MSYKVLEQNGVTNENVDGAGFNYFASGKKDGILGGILNECAVYSPASNIVSIGTGVISVQGFRVKITSDISWAVSGNADEYSIIFEIILNPDRSVSSQFIAQPSSLSLIKNDLLVDEEGTHQTEIIRFNWDGIAVSNISRKLPVIIAGSGSGGVSIELAQDVEGDSTEKAVSQKAVKDALGGKVDIKTNRGRWVYTTEEGVQTIRRIGTTPVSWNIPWFDENKNLKSSTPVADLDVTNKQFVENTVAPIANDVANLKKMVGVKYEMHRETYSSNSITSPERAMPYAYISKLSPLFPARIKNNILSFSPDNIVGDYVTYDAEEDVFIIDTAGVSAKPKFEIPIDPINLGSDGNLYVAIEVLSGSHSRPFNFWFDHLDADGNYTYESGSVSLAIKEMGKTAIIHYQDEGVPLNAFGFPGSKSGVWENVQVRVTASTEPIFDYANCYPSFLVDEQGASVLGAFQFIEELTYNGYPVGDLSMLNDNGEWVYNYADFEAKEFVVRCYRESENDVVIAPEEIRIDISNYALEPEISASALPEISTSVLAGGGYFADTILNGKRRDGLSCEIAYVLERG